MTPHIVAREYDLVVRGQDRGSGRANVHPVSAEAFDALRRFVSVSVEGHQGQTEVIARPTLHGSQPALRLQQWVGVIRTPDGTTLEILPKTHQREQALTTGEDSAQRSRGLLFRMLAVAGDNYRAALPADLDPARIPLFEVVLRYGLEIFRRAVRQGVPHTYQQVREERSGLRGRLDLTRQVRQLPYRAHLLHVTYDEFSPDRPETRLVRLAVERVARMTRRDDTRRLARELLYALENVPASRDVRRDFRSWKLERGYRHFAPALEICHLILNELNPLTAGSSSRVTAVLFDMNRVYETYVAHLIRQQYPDWTVQTQVRGHFLGRTPPVRNSKEKTVFALRPDLVLDCGDDLKVVADTKWKRLDASKAFPHGVLNTDAYQMLAYSEIFQQGVGPRQLYLIYPHIPGLPSSFLDIKLPEGRLLRLITVDLDQVSPAVNLGGALPAEPDETSAFE